MMPRSFDRLLGFLVADPEMSSDATRLSRAGDTRADHVAAFIERSLAS
jgi:hypothetical protein